jgi:pantoate--beta-alanine ligase
VTTLVAKLLNIVRPTHVMVGQRDVQHVAVLRKMAADLNYEVEFLVVPTVREMDGLVAAVRNKDLTPASGRRRFRSAGRSRWPRRWWSPESGAPTASSLR